MEHRWSARVPISSRVTLYRNKLPVAICTARDIGRGGLFVSEAPLDYAENTILDIDFPLLTTQGVKRFRMPVCVVHRAKRGMGLMFLENCEEISREVRWLSRSSTDQAQASAAQACFVRKQVTA